MTHDVGLSLMTARNVHEALPRAMALLQLVGQRRESRNGPVIVAPWLVTTVYAKPVERVLFWPERDANPFLHLYESLWILAGREDAAPLIRYAQNFRNYTDDGVRFHAPYGWRWRQQWGDQLAKIARRLTEDPTDRRCVLQTWSAELDLDVDSKDIPCNVMLTFQRGTDGELNLVVFQRSADIIWGTYGANAVQMGTLQEYMAAWIGCPVGTLTHVSVNWHAYAEVFDKMYAEFGGHEPSYATPWRIETPYDEDLEPEEAVAMVPLIPPEAAGQEGVKAFDAELAQLMRVMDARFPAGASGFDSRFPFLRLAHEVLLAHEVWRMHAAPERYDLALEVLAGLPAEIDWVRAAREWMLRRLAKWEERMHA